MKAQPVLRIENTLLGEGPVWDYRRKELWWVDIENGLLHFYHPQKDRNRTYGIGQMVGAAIPCEKGGLILAMHHGLAFFNPDTEELNPIVDPESDLPGNRFNDAKCDPAGRLWAGTMAIDKPRNKVGSLYCLDSSLQVTKKLSDITVSNGLAWNRAADRMFYIDSETQIVWSFLFDLESGEIEKEADALKFERIIPDGMCIDENDNLWIAFYGSAMVCCFDPKTGEQLEQIDVPAKQTTSCAFGGESLDTLYITSSNRVEKSEWGGSLFAVKPGVKGRKANFFKYDE